MQQAILALIDWSVSVVTFLHRFFYNCVSLLSSDLMSISLEPCIGRDWPSVEWEQIEAGTQANDGSCTTGEHHHRQCRHRDPWPDDRQHEPLRSNRSAGGCTAEPGCCWPASPRPDLWSQLRATIDLRWDVGGNMLTAWVEFWIVFCLCLLLLLLILDFGLDTAITLLHSQIIKPRLYVSIYMDLWREHHEEFDSGRQRSRTTPTEKQARNLRRDTST